MADQKKLDRWAEKLLDTGKRNNLINFRDSKTSTAEVLYPECERIFSRCAVGHIFEIYDPKILDDDIYDFLEEKPEDNKGVSVGENKNKNTENNSEVNDVKNTEEQSKENNKPTEEKKLSREEYKELYAPKIRNNRYLLAYTQIPNPRKAIKNIAKRAKAVEDETGINVSYLAFGFVKWNEKEGSDRYYRAPLLLVHVSILAGSIADPVKIEISDDDVVVNPTFDYLLQADYGVSLPAFEDGDTLGAYYEKVSAIVRRMGWEVLDECKLGIFSFLKINMYEDLKNNAEFILENENVQALLGESVPESSGLAGDISDDFGSKHVVKNPLVDLHTVVDADSSQIEAIEMAKSGKSFVLQGPPGTGKSQTITNIIAECLHDGKKVLFVSEKQAALNVVFGKLKNAGLADFCLELHSHKANKKAVIEELNRTLEIPRSAVSSSAQEEIRQKKEAQFKLDEYATALHKKRGEINKSLYQLFELSSAQREYPDLSVRIQSIEKKGQEYLLDATRHLEQYEDYIDSIGQNYRENPWYGFTKKQLTFDERNQLKNDLELLSQGYKNLQDLTGKIKIKYETPELNFSDTTFWQTMLEFSASSDVITPSLLSLESIKYAVPYINQLAELSKTIIPARERVLGVLSEEAIRDLDGKEIHEKLTSQFSGFFSRLFNGEYKSLMANIQRYSKNGVAINYTQAVDVTDQLTVLQANTKIFDEAESHIHGCLGTCYCGPDTDWDHTLSSLGTLQSFYKEETPSFGMLSTMGKREFLDQKESFREDAAALSEEMDRISEAKQKISNLFDRDIFDLDKNSYDYCIWKLKGCVADFEKLGNWIAFMELLEQLEKLELSPFIDAAITEHIPAKDITGAYKKAFYKQWIEYVLFSVPELASFSRIKQDQAVKSFVEKDNLQYEISKLQIKAELSQNRPKLEVVAGGSAVSILRREGQKKRKQMPIRKLLSEIGDLVQIIKPCFLMSPLSVSTFLASGKISFDTIVFDEASQIFPQDAIGAIYRGKQLIVVGDSKQMPPSNFFNSSLETEDEDEEVGDINDFESVLDICSSVFNTERLTWHYRSHYEQLIAFSNMNFYRNNLVTFPSSATDHEGIGVDYYYVNGVFDRKSKTNRTEADFIVDLIYKNIDKYPDRSLGVVAFSVAQQSLIDALLSKRRESDPSYEWFFNEDSPEPFFIKNLETVQGDERDTVIFSVAYAPDSTGRFIHNFGPLNRDGGERRLNVAVTRAKDNVQLVASIHYTDINLNNAGSEGVRLLRAYLDYAQNGEQALERILDVAEEDHFDSYFEQEVCDYLRDQGLTVDTQVGCSGYRIDLGIRKPDSSNYVLAVECDGATYHSSKNARDRDSLRQRVLENMGWQFYRIWSTDWYRNKVVEKERLLQAAKEALKKKKRIDETCIKKKRSQGQTFTADLEERFVTEIPQYEHPLYKEEKAVEILYKHWNDIQAALCEILETEAPLSEEYFLKRIVSTYDRAKVTKVVIQDFNKRMQGCEDRGIIRRDGFLYLRGQNEIRLRIPGDKREIKYISLEELSAGLYTMIKQSISIPKDSLYKSMVNLLGYNRTGEAIVARFDKALEMLKDHGFVIETDSVLSAK